MTPAHASLPSSSARDSKNDISIISNNDSGWFDRGGSKRIDRDADGTDDRAEGAATGAGIGATLGGAAGLLAGLGLLAIPGIGPVVAAGWLASTAALAIAGGATGGLIGALTQSGVGEQEAHAYAEGVRRGETLVTVRAPDADRARIEAIMDRYSRTTTTTIGAAYGGHDWSGERVVAAFENTDRAGAAREALIADGIDNAKMELLDNRSDLDNWSAIKGHAVPDEDAHLYAEGLGRGHSMLVIRANAGEHDRIMKVSSASIRSTSTITRPRGAIPAGPVCIRGRLPGMSTANPPRPVRRRPLPRPRNKLFRSMRRS